MRRVRALLSLAKKYGDRVDEVCRIALAADRLDVRRLTRMLEAAVAPSPAEAPLAKVIPIARHLRAPTQYALPLASGERRNPTDEGDPK
jgi:hypothetical protein